MTTGLIATFDVTSSVDGSAHRVRVAVPPGPVPETGHPLLYVLDGDGYFGLFTDAARNLGPIGFEIAAPVVVGIGYPDEDVATWMKRRVLDLTPSLGDPATLLAHHASIDRGGLDKYLDLIGTEIAHGVSQITPIDRSRSALFGHSLGGLATLYAAFTRPDFASNFVAVSPSVWWDKGFMRSREDAFAEHVRGGGEFPSIFIGVGGAEQTPPTTVPKGADIDAIRRHLESARVVDNARELASRLKSIAAPSGGRVQYEEVVGETHMGAPFCVAMGAVRFAFGV